MLGKIVKVHGHNGRLFSNKNGGWEFPALWTVVLVAVGLRGDGAATLVSGIVGRRMLWLRRTSPCRTGILPERMSCTEAIAP